MVLPPGDSSKLAGRLSFCAQHAFRRMGRAAIRPLFAQQYAPLQGNRVGPRLELALRWWLRILSLHLVELVELVPGPRECVDLFCDAQGSPPRVGVVCCVRDQILFTSSLIPPEVFKQLVDRRDEQIMALELIAITVGIATFADHLRGRAVRLWCDNAGGEHGLRKGGAKCEDHNLIIHSVWLAAARLGMALWIERVESALNVADLPSRGSYHELLAAGAKWRAPVIPAQLVCFDKLWEMCLAQ